MTAPQADRDLAGMLRSKVAKDPVLPERLRRLGQRTGPEYDDPVLALLRLQEEALVFLQQLERRPSRQPLARLLTASTYLRWYTKPEYRDAFQTPEDFIAYVDTTAQPNETLRQTLTVSSPLFSWHRSWLTSERHIARKDGAQLLHDLEMPGEPPVIICHFSLDSLARAGVDVRLPCSLDAVLGPHYQWRPGGLASGADEFIDGNIPLEALSYLEWRH